MKYFNIAVSSMTSTGVMGIEKDVNSLICALKCHHKSKDCFPLLLSSHQKDIAQDYRVVTTVIAAIINFSDMFFYYTVRIWDQVSNPLNFYDIRSTVASVNLFQIFAKYIFCPTFTRSIARCELVLYVYYIPSNKRILLSSWWRHQMETISALLAIHRSSMNFPHKG